MSEHFCSCTMLKCPRHPANQGNGCDPCIQENIKKKKMPVCLFKAVNDDVSEVRDFSMQGFVEFYLKHQTAKTKTC